MMLFAKQQRNHQRYQTTINSILKWNQKKKKIMQTAVTLGNFFLFVYKRRCVFWHLVYLLPALLAFLKPFRKVLSFQNGWTFRPSKQFPFSWSARQFFILWDGSWCGPISKSANISQAFRDYIFCSHEILCLTIFQWIILTSSLCFS